MEVFEAKTNGTVTLKAKSRKKRKMKITNTHLKGIDLTKGTNYIFPDIFFLHENAFVIYQRFHN